MFRAVPLSIIRSLLYVQWKTPDYGQRNCLKHVEFYSKNKFEKLLHLVDFIISNIALAVSCMLSQDKMKQIYHISALQVQS